MKHFLQFATLTTIGAFTSCSDQKSETEQNVTISGEVFVTTRGGDTIKISGADISFFPRDSVQSAYDQALRSAPANIPRYDKAITEWTKLATEFDRIRDKVSGYKRDEMLEEAKSCRERIADLKNAQAEWPHASYIFTFLSEAEFKTLTDSDGKFSVSLPAGDWIAVAESRRSIGGTEERYYWTLPAKADKPLLLTNRNMVTSSDEESVIKATLGYFKSE